jgi:hypothetical protein
MKHFELVSVPGGGSWFRVGKFWFIKMRGCKPTFHAFGKCVALPSPMRFLRSVRQWLAPEFWSVGLHSCDDPNWRAWYFVWTWTPIHFRKTEQAWQGAGDGPNTWAKISLLDFVHGAWDMGACKSCGGRTFHKTQICKTCRDERRKGQAA